jgi:hypothetical protein
MALQARDRKHLPASNIPSSIDLLNWQIDLSFALSKKPNARVLSDLLNARKEFCYRLGDYNYKYFGVMQIVDEQNIKMYVFMSKTVPAGGFVSFGPNAHLGRESAAIEINLNGNVVSANAKCYRIYGVNVGKTEGPISFELKGDGKTVVFGVSDELMKKSIGLLTFGTEVPILEETPR